MQAIDVGGRTLGAGAPCFVAAEVGINHNGDVELARELIDAAAAAGADAVKFQNYRAEDFVSNRSLTYEYISQGERVVESQYEMFKRCELRPGALETLREHCAARGVIFFSTPSGEEGLAELVEIGAPLLKNGSDYLGHLPLIRAMACTGLPTVLSTGMAIEEEITRAVDAFREAGGEQLVLLHCTSSYPTPDDEVNVRRIPALAQRYRVPAGLSDHSWGVTAAIGAVALGACMIEKHFTLSRDLPGPDHRFSADPAELTELVSAVRRVEVQLGDSQFQPTPSEERGRDEYRLSCVAARDLPAGHTLRERDITFSRPATGIPPAEVATLVGTTLRNSVHAGDLLER